MDGKTFRTRRLLNKLLTLSELNSLLCRIRPKADIDPADAVDSHRLDLRSGLSILSGHIPTKLI